mgnify:CR=1 FL=1
MRHGRHYATETNKFHTDRAPAHPCRLCAALYDAGARLSGYTLWGAAVLVFLFPRLHRVGRTVLGVLVCAGLIVLHGL